MTGTRSSIGLAVLVFLLASIVAVSTWAADGASHRHTAQAKPAVPTKPATPGAPKVSRKSPAAEYTPTVRFRLRTELAEGKMAFVGAGGEIEGVVNPTLRVAVGDVVQVSLVNNDGIEHDVAFPDFNAGTDRVNRKGASSVTVFRADKAGEFAYFCTLPGRRGPSASISRRSSSSAGWPTRRRTPTGRSTARCRDRSCASASTTPWSCASRTRPTAA